MSEEPDRNSDDSRYVLLPALLAQGLIQAIALSNGNNRASCLTLIVSLRNFYRQSFFEPPAALAVGLLRSAV